MSHFKIRPLHRQRKGRRKTAKVLDQAELAGWLNVSPDAVEETLDAMKWPYHKDSAGKIWARAPDEYP